MFPAKDVEETTTTSTTQAPTTASASPKWVFASTTTAPEIRLSHNIYAAPATGSAFDMQMKTTNEATSPAPSNSRNHEPVGVQQAPTQAEFKEFIVGEVTGNGQCRCPVDPDVYFRR